MSDTAARVDALFTKFRDLQSFALRAKLESAGPEADEWIEVHRTISSRHLAWRWSSGSSREDGTREERGRSRDQATFADTVTALAAAFAGRELRPDTIAFELLAHGRNAKKLALMDALRAPATQALCEAFGSPVPEIAEALPEAPLAETRGRGQDLPAFAAAKGKVALFVNAGLDAPDEEEEDEEPPFRVDPDRFEGGPVVDGNLAMLRSFSHGESFADEAIRAIEKLGVKVTYVFALYESAPKKLRAGPLPEPWKRSPGVFVYDNPAYVGAFTYAKKSGR